MNCLLIVSDPCHALMKDFTTLLSQLLAALLLHQNQSAKNLPLALNNPKYMLYLALPKLPLYYKAECVNYIRLSHKGTALMTY